MIETEWPQQQHGIIPEDGTTKLTEFQIKLVAFEPQSTGQQIVHAEAFRQFNEYVDRRRQRLQSVGSGLPDILWYVLGVGAFFNIVLIWLFHIERLSLHVLLAGILSLLISLMIFLIAAMDYPFRGKVSISADPFEMLRDSIRQK